ncbi:APC family permease [Blastopirellula sp. JC732]|uniref:APC family permease n=1 Tax=Blastopirellula sediminis TaxID=2894196 RepID=A0A9X1SLE7_9BACT|nr:APC family permease [Blastopirellula sediminis]MCC9606087.1 APC family permease [Blastopirellula sediminis]MCC9630614.1 APC family permease [Blastopirellula sediminis]
MNDVPPDSSDAKQPPRLKREVGLAGAILLGLGSIIGTGIFVSIGIAAGATGPALLLAIPLAAFLAICNGLSSAQLAAAHPVSGGTYEYGYRWLHPSLGFLAGWMFVAAKSASAATAALGFSGYLLNLLKIDAAAWRLPVSLLIVLLVTGAILTGIRRSNFANAVLVSTSLLALALLIAFGLPSVSSEQLTPFFAPVTAAMTPTLGFAQAVALMFVAYTGYGRIATLGEEVENPRRTIPVAIIATLFIAMAFYWLIGLVAIGVLGAEELASATLHQGAPLEIVAMQIGSPLLATVIAIGATTAMAGVLLNLVLGLSRVVLAMGRRRDLPAIFGELNASHTTPTFAVLLVAAIVMGLTLIGDVKTTWSFSAFTVLIYYALTNLAAIRLAPEERLYPAAFAWIGLAICLLLPFWVDRAVWQSGLALIAAGLVWHFIAMRLRNS